MNIAIEGCLHGELQNLYAHLQSLEKKSGIKIDLLLICGDFQAIRDLNDLDHMHCPPKYKSMGHFCDYFQGKKIAPYLTIFIGGNHEAVNYMRDLYFGGWAAPKIYYLGQAGSIIVKNNRTKTSLRISGMSGIFNQKDFHYVLRTEKLPLYGKSRISAYHLKQLDVFRMELFSRILMMKKQNPTVYGNDSSASDIFMTHDWPKDMAFYGDLNQLYRYKSFLKKQIDNGQFGSPPFTRLLKLLKPAYWFAAHIHIKYSAIFPHLQNHFTHFLALDKCLQKRSCLQLLRFSKENSVSQIQDKQQENKPDIQIRQDPVWLSVLKLTMSLQTQNHSYYKIHDHEAKILDGKFMNELIEKYGQIREKLEEYEQKDLICEVKRRDQLPEDYQEIDQTIRLMKQILKADPTKLFGVIFQKDQQKKAHLEMEKEKCEEGNGDGDQIDLDL